MAVKVSSFKGWGVEATSFAFGKRFDLSGI